MEISVQVKDSQGVEYIPSPPVRHVSSPVQRWRVKLYNQSINLVVYGVNEKQDEAHGTLLGSVVTNIFACGPRVKLTSVEPQILHWQKKSQARATCCDSIYDSTEKMAGLQSCFKLKCSTISVSQDFSLAVRETDRNLWQLKKTLNLTTAIKAFQCMKT